VSRRPIKYEDCPRCIHPGCESLSTRRTVGHYKGTVKESFTCDKHFHEGMEKVAVKEVSIWIEELAT
jgi:hypothetical protein